MAIINSAAVRFEAPALTLATLGNGGKLLTAFWYLLGAWAVFLVISIYGHVWPYVRRLIVVSYPNGVWG